MTATPAGVGPAASPSRLWGGAARRWILGLILLTVVTRLPALAHPKMIDDERVYSVVAIEMLEGGKPYVSAVERKPPLLFWTYAGILAVVGRYNTLGFHAAAVLWILLTMAGLYAAGRVLFDRRTGFFAALLYSVYQPWLFGGNLALNGEVLMNLPLAWAVFLTLKPTRSRLRLELLPAGVLCCAGFLLKQPAAIAALPLALYLLSPGYRAGRGLELRHSLLHATWLTVGFFGTLGLIAAALQAQGILAEAYYWTITDHDIPLIRWDKAVVMSLAFVVFGWPLVAGTLISLREVRGREMAVWTGRRPELLALAGLLLASLVGTAAGGRFYHHYYIQLVPPLALLAAPVWAQVSLGAVARRSRLFSWKLNRAWLAASILLALVSHTKDLAAQRQLSDVGRFLRAHSSPDDRIFVWGQAAGVYLEAQRRPTTRYIHTFPLTGYVFGWPLRAAMPDTRDRILPGAWQTFEREIAERAPRFIVDAEVVRRPHPRYPMDDYPVLKELLQRDYRLIERAAAGWIYERIRGG